MQQTPRLLFVLLPNVRCTRHSHRRQVASEKRERRLWCRLLAGFLRSVSPMDRHLSVCSGGSRPLRYQEPSRHQAFSYFSILSASRTPSYADVCSSYFGVRCVRVTCGVCTAAAFRAYPSIGICDTRKEHQFARTEEGQSFRRQKSRRRRLNRASEAGGQESELEEILRPSPYPLQTSNSADRGLQIRSFCQFPPLHLLQETCDQ